MIYASAAAAFVFFGAGFFIAWRVQSRKIDGLAVALQGTGESGKTVLADEARDWMPATLGSMAEGVIIVDARGRALVVNAALREALGLKNVSEGAYFWEIFRDSEVNEMLETCLRKRRVARKEHSVLLSEKTFEIQVSPVSGDGDLLGAVGVFHDVTRLKELERIRAEFVANVSHELKTPLTSILGYVETLAEGAVEDKENRMKFLAIIDDHAKKLSGLIEDLLLLSSVESGKNALRLESVDVEKILEKVLRYLDFKIREKKIRIEKEIAPAPFFIRVDAALFERVLSNLLDNAVKYSAAGGRVLVRALENASGPVIEILDDGIGISESDLARIFERFYRVDKSRSRESGGAGLGLSIAKHIVESHGGKLEVESALQKGSKFTVRLQYNQ